MTCLGQQWMVGELSAPLAGLGQLPYAEGVSGGHREGVHLLVRTGGGARYRSQDVDPSPGGSCGAEGITGPTPGAGERVEGGGLGHRVARAPGELDSPFGVGDRLLRGVVRVSLDRAVGVRDHRCLGQRNGRLGGRVADAGQLSRFADRPLAARDLGEWGGHENEPGGLIRPEVPVVGCCRGRGVGRWWRCR
ncbi:hypothetical protein E1182_03290 [Micromonospora sp. KC721]|nr:hypothetical protein E1182_03290 [Micromonospora sp. KC721]